MLSSLIGYYSLVIGLCISSLIIFFSFKNFQDLKILDSKIILFSFTQLVLVFMSFLGLVASFIFSDFSNEIVFNNSHTTKPLFYKISGTWGNHEGSLLLWLLVLTLFIFIFLVKSKNQSKKYRILTVIFQQIIIIGFFVFLIKTSNPFSYLFPVPEEGLGLNPILQDPALAIHPPILYLGYVGSSIIFSSVLAATTLNYINNDWAKHIKSWVLISWIFLTLGILLGSIWAYYELGWGGFWFWDPVENVSLMPWLALTTLLHCILVLEKRSLFKSWVIILSIATFTLSMCGTFLVRSGILNSVHTFANDPSRGLYILIFLSLMIIFSFIIFAKRRIRDQFNVEPISKETFILSNNWFMMFYLATVFIGTIYPIFTQVIYSTNISVGPPFYNQVIAPIIIPFLIFMAVGPKIGWIKHKYDNYKTFLIIIILSCVINFFIFFFFKSYNLISNLIIISSLFLILHSIKDFFVVAKTKSYLNLASFVSHFGFGFLIFFIILNYNFSKEFDLNIKVGETKQIGEMEIKFNNLALKQRENYNAVIGDFNIQDFKKNYLKKLNPEIRIYESPKTLTFEAAISSNFIQDIYLTMSNMDGSDFYNVKFQVKPFMFWIWLSAFLTASGGFVRIFLRKK